MDEPGLSLKLINPDLLQSGDSRHVDYASSSDSSTPKSLLGDQKDVKFLRSFSSALAVLSGILFIIGSVCYFEFGLIAIAERAHEEFGGYFFTIGSLFYIVHDTIEFLLDWNHISTDGEYRKEENDKESASEIHWDFIFNLHGSIFYFIGSVFFIPEVNQMVVGLYIFIYASVVILIIETFRLLKLGCQNNEFKYGFAFANWMLHTQDFYSSIGLIFAEIFYIIGCTCFLPQYDLNDTTTNVASLLFVIGSVIITMSTISHTYHFGETINERPVTRKLNSPRALRATGFYSPTATTQRYRPQF